ncbi:MAG: tyrosine-type recombinase/integrase [Candidatus Natronoplasma sp.]
MSHLEKTGNELINVTERLKNNDKVLEENKQKILDFDRYLRLNDYSANRRYKYLTRIQWFAEFLDKPFEETERREIEDMVFKVKDKDVAQATKNDYKVLLKRFYKWVNGGEYPECIKWLNTSSKAKARKIPEELLTEEDVTKLIKSCENARNRAFISLLWESGARIGELIDITIGSLEDHKHGLQVTINGKTGYRHLILISSVPHLRSWINSHPMGDDKDAPLWVNIGTRNHGEQARYRALRKVLDKVAANAGIDKPVNPHHFRHSRATYLASRFTEAQMNEWFGWVQGSDVPAHYVHMSGRDISGTYARLHGKEEKENERQSKLAPKECPRCGNSVPPDGEYCYKCGMALSLEAARDIEEDEAQAAEVFSEAAQEDPDMLKDMQDFMQMIKVIRSDNELMENLQQLVKEKKGSG